jgi:hypothetical protein
VLRQLESGAYGMFDLAVVTLLIRKFMQALIRRDRFALCRPIR